MQIKSREWSNQKRETGLYAKQPWRQMQTKHELCCGAEEIQTGAQDSNGSGSLGSEEETDFIVLCIMIIFRQNAACCADDNTVS